MAETIISTVLQTLGDILVQETVLIFEFKEELRKMDVELQYMQSFLSDASQRKKKNRILRTTMDELRDLLYDIDDLLADVHIKSRPMGNWMLKFIHFCSPMELWDNHKMAKRLQIINQRISEVKGRIVSYLGPLTYQSSRLDSSSPRWVPLDIKKSDFVGMDEEIKKIRLWIFQEDHPIDVFAIVGMGGLGKTTLAHRFFSDADVKNRFPYRISVSVGRKIKDEVLIKRMLSDLDVEDDAIRGEVDDQLHLLHQRLKGRYLIVLDDVWETGSYWWHRLRSGLPPINGSKIIITTRNEHVARTMGAGDDRICHPKLLSKEESWSLFHEIAFVTSPYIPNRGLEIVGRKIAERCGGLPLAIKTVAGMMLGKPAYVKDWELVLQNLMLELAESKDGEVVMKCLQLSYDDLPPQLRSCLLCFSIFPEEYEISKRKLIYWWIGEGFAKENMGKTAEKIAEDYFMEMVSRCLILKEGIKSHNEKVVSCRIHDLVRDLVIRIAREEAFMRFADECTDGNSRRSSIGSTNMNSFEAKRKLRSLVAPTDPKLSEDHHLLGTILREFRLLRVLDLGKFYVGSWDCIGHLLHLVYLSLKGNEQVVELPNSIGKLTNLQILDLHGCNQLKGLPSHITRLENLTHLNVHNCDNLKYFPKGMGKLIKLQVLRGFKFDTSSSTRFCKITELKSLTRLHRLTIYIDSIRETKIDDFGELSQLQFLRSLELVAPYDCDSDDGETKRMIEELRPPHQVEKLKLRGNYGEWLPSWLQPFALPSLRTLSIHSQGGQTMRESFLSCETGFWRLKVLLLFNVKIEGDWWRTRRAMPHLKYLQVPSVVKHFPCDQRGVWKKVSKHGRREEITEETISSLS